MVSSKRIYIWTHSYPAVIFLSAISEHFYVCVCEWMREENTAKQIS